VLIDLQGLPISDDFTSEAFGISADGSTIVGRGTPLQRAWRLDDQFNTIFLGDMQGGGDLSTARAVSADGSVVVGQAHGPNGPEAFRWTEDSGIMVGLGDLPGAAFESSAFGVSADGTIVVGYGVNPGGTLSGAEAFRWRLTNPDTGAGQMVGLGDLPGGDSTSVATGVSADGAVVVGASPSTLSDDFSIFATEAFRWTLTDPLTGAGVMEGLGDLPGAGFNSFAMAVSGDGTTVVGRGTSNEGTEAFHWRDGVMTGLGDLPGGNFLSVANAVSADGSVVVGYSAVGIGDGGLNILRPFIWDEAGGMRDLVEVFLNEGLALENLAMTSATGVSADGRTFTGIGESDFNTPGGTPRTEAWVGRLVPDVPGDYNGNGRVEQADLDLVLLNWGDPASGLPPTWINERPTSGNVDQAELDGVLLGWGDTAARPADGAFGRPLGAIPEPPALMLGLLLLPVAAGACTFASTCSNKRTLVAREPAA
jgi:probable HAF family extracellular repeat protein